MLSIPASRRRSKVEFRWLRAGRCVVCGKPRAKKTRRFKRRSKRFCPKHLEKNREYQAIYRQALKPLARNRR
jgi:hypothetical protein